MHNASHGVVRSTTVAPWTDAVPAFLLQGSDQSSTCLMCHGDTSTGAGLAGPVATGRPYVIANTGPALAQMNYSPGGDFGWLSQTVPGGGHKVSALDFAMAGSAQIAPGGTFTPEAAGIRAFACSNCHDPHGRARMELTDVGATTWQWANGSTIKQPIYSSGSYGMLPKDNGAVGAYRLLAGVGYFPASNPTGAFAFPNSPPVAMAPANYNHSETGGIANQVRVAYGTGMSEWCQNCHTNIHLNNYTSGAMGGTGLKHPTGRGAILKPGQFSTYNAYVSSGTYGGPNVNGEGAVDRGHHRDQHDHLRRQRAVERDVPLLSPRPRVGLPRRGPLEQRRHVHHQLGHGQLRGHAGPHQHRPGGRVLRPLAGRLRCVPALHVQQVPRQGLTAPARPS
jgi:hypothetical protein